MNARALLVVASLVSLPFATAHAQGYPYAQPMYVPAPPPSVAPPQQQVIVSGPRPFDPFEGRFLRGYFGTTGFVSLVLNQNGGAERLKTGAGYSFFGGLDFGRVVGLQLSYTSSSHNPSAGCDPIYEVCSPSVLSLEMVTADLRLHLPTGTHFRPFVQAGIGPAWIGRGEYLSDAVGAGFDVGGGFEYYLGRFFTLGVDALYRGVRLNDYAVETGGDTTLGILSIEGSLALHF